MGPIPEPSIVALEGQQTPRTRYHKKGLVELHNLIYPDLYHSCGVERAAQLQVRPDSGVTADLTSQPSRYSRSFHSGPFSAAACSYRLRRLPAGKEQQGPSIEIGAVRCGSAVLERG
jgi:hypothetical protein